MIKTINYLILIYSVCCINWWQPYTTSVYTNNILYVYDTFRDDAKSSRITKYDLKDGLIKNLKKEYFSLDSGNLYNSPQFFAIDDNIKNKFPNGNSAWMFTCDNGPYKSNLGVDYPNAQLKYIDNGKKEVLPSDKVRELYSGNMTQSGYSVNGVTKSGSFAIFIFGGITKHPNYKDLVVTNTFHKYYLKDNEWKDLSSSTIKERPSAFHKAVSIDDKYLFLLGGVSAASNKANTPMIENTQAMSFNSFENIRRYNITKGKWDTIKTSTSGNFPVDLNLGRYGFSATYAKGKIYVYGGMVSENGSITGKETISPYLGILDTNTLMWEWFHPTDSKGKTVNRGLSFHDSMIINDQLLLIHGGVSDEKYKYKIHAIDLETKQFSNYIGPPTSDSLDEEDTNPDSQGSQETKENQETKEGSGFPGYAIAIIVVAIIFIIAIVAYLIIRKRRQKKLSKRDSLQTLQEVWATPKNAILHTKIHDTTDSSLMTGNTFTNLSSPSTDMQATTNSLQMNRSDSRVNQYYMNLPYFQHEVDTQDQRISTMMATNIQLLSHPDNHNTNLNQQQQQ